MFENLDKVKSQLAELAPLINSFKSEAVQLKILEIIFFNSNTDISSSTTKLKKRKSNSTVKKSEKSSDGKTKTKVTKKGPTYILNELITEGFFNTKKTLSDIVAHCENNRATIIPQNNFSNPLGNLVRQKKLKRKKNEEDVYEYTAEK